MREYFGQKCIDVTSVASDVEARVILMSSIRHLLQMTNFALLEWIASRNPEPDLQPAPEVLRNLLIPSDGTLVDALESLLLCAEQNGWTGIFRPLVDTIENEVGCEEICGNHPQTLVGLLRALVALRNDGGEGHGLPGGYRRTEESAALRFVVAKLGDAIPKLVGDEIEVGPAGREVRVRMLRSISGNPVLIRKIKSLNASSVRVQGMYYDAHESLRNISYEAWNPFTRFAGETLPTLRQFDNSWQPLCYIPDRVTDTFVGRDDERREIVEWLEDEGSRACLVFGDGGVGKTTLVVETLHEVLEEVAQCSWKPSVVTFYTAKRLQFGLRGLEPIGAGKPHLMDLLVHLHILLVGCRPDTSFYKKDVLGAATVLQEIMKNSINLKRSEHLIVVDNAETLIESDAERDLLGRELKEIVRKVGRVLLTSRRREILGADPVEVKSLTKIEAVGFLRKRGGDKLSLTSIKRATDLALVSVVEDLERRPIVLEAFVNALTDPATSTLDKAKTKVLGMLQKDLGTFLFSDAWARFSREIRSLLVLMTRVADVHDAQSFRICADLSKVPIQDAEKALSESSGIASVVHIDGGIQVSFSRNFLDFCRERDVVSADQVSLARSRYSQFISRVSSFSGDRILEAFRTPLARAAHKAKSDGDLEAAQDLYEQAVLSDSSNGLLFDRYAYFLFHDIHNNEAALHKAKRATELLSTSGECWYTRGLIEARLGDLRAAENSLAKAESLGVSPTRCALQLAWAYLKSRPRPQLALAEKQLRQLDTTTNSLPDNSRVRLEIRNIKERLAFLLSRKRQL